MNLKTLLFLVLVAVGMRPARAFASGNLRCFQYLIVDGVLHFHNKRFEKALRRQRETALAELREHKALRAGQHHWDSTFFEPGEFVRVNDNHFKVLSVLGSGGEANVYVVETPNGPRTAKIYNTKALGRLESEAAAIHAWRKKGVNILEPQEVDPNSGVILFPYVEGFTIAEIKKSAMEMGLTPGETAQILLKSIRFNENEEFGSLPPVLLDTNTIYDVNSDEIVMVDRS